MDFAFKTCVILSASMLSCCIGQTPVESQVPFTIEIIPGAANQQFKLKLNRVLRCTASATDDNQKPTLYWEINGVRITSRTDRIRMELTSDNNSLMLRIDNIQDGDEGIYKCVATLGSQTDSRSVRVQVIQDLVVNSSPNQFGLFGEDGEVKCEAIAKPPASITWKDEDGNNILSGTKRVILSDRLLIKNLDDDDSKTYICDIIVIDTGESRAFPISFQVVHPPKIEMIPIISPNNPKEGDPEVKITCRAAGIPPPTYEFKKGDNLLKEDQVDKINGILIIRNLKREDEANYTCVATNIGGSDQKSNRLDVKIPPIILDIPDVTSAVENEMKKVTCTAKGDPAPTVIWQKQGLPAYNDGVRESGPEIILESGTERDDAEIKTVTKSMSFNSIKPQDVGTYICTAINVVGNATKTMKFEVKYAPTFTTDFKDKVFFGWKGHTANLTCLVSANEMASIQWFETKESDQVRVENDSPYTLTTPQHFPDYYLTSSSLMVYVADDNSPVFKEYECFAVNTLGEARYKVELRRALPPMAPVVKVPSVLSTKVTLEIIAPTETGGLPVIGYHYSYYPESEMSNKVEKDIDSTLGVTIVDLKDLKANTPYVVRTSARNAAGRGQDIPVSFQTKVVSSPLTLDIISPSEGPDATMYTLRWGDVEDGGSKVIRYIIKYRAVVVKGEDSSQWIVFEDIQTKFTEEIVTDPNARSYTIKGLIPNSHYDIRIIAENKEGKSPEAYKIIKTSQGAAAGTDDGSASLTVNVTGMFLLLILACLSAPW